MRPEAVFAVAEDVRDIAAVRWFHSDTRYMKYSRIGGAPGLESLYEGKGIPASAVAAMESVDLTPASPAA